MGEQIKTKTRGYLEIRETADRRCGGTKYAVFLNEIKLGFWTRHPETARSTFEKATKNYRPCLCCRDFFVSDGPHNRLCNQCRAIRTGLE